jgi:hypothetical protein
MDAPTSPAKVKPVSVEEFEVLIEKAHWQSAKSTEDVAPHQYCVRGWDKDNLTDDEFWAMHATIKHVGRLEEWTPPAEWVQRWGGKPMKNRYLYIGDFAYWFTWPRGRVPMLNREHRSVQKDGPTRRIVEEG